MERNGKKYVEWKARVNVRDNFICQECGNQGRDAHHIKPWKENPKLRFDVSNGITLCLECHKKYGRGGRPKIKDGKAVTLYISFDTIERLKDQAYKNKKSMSQYVEDLINGDA